MKLIKPLSLGLLTRPYQQHGQFRYAVSALGFFRLGNSAPHLLNEGDCWADVLAALPPGQTFDEVYPKPHGEVLLAGTAHVHGEQPQTEMTVRLVLGPVDKSLRVFGDRRWYYGPWLRRTPPVPFKQMPLEFARAYGGPRLAENPLGCGYTGNPFAGWVGQNEGAMANLEVADEPVRDHVRKLVPASLGAIDAGWAPRQRYAGTYDARWLEEDAPGLARDLDPRFFQTAAADQWRDGPWQGDETYLLEGVHPALAMIRGQLPGFCARCFVKDKGATAPREVAMALDTVWFFPEAMLGVLVFHGSTEISDSDALDLEAVLLAYEALGSRQPVAHYTDVLAQRLDPSKAALLAMADWQLVPALPAEVIAANTAARAERQAKKLADQQAALDETMDEFWATSGLEKPADYQPPKVESSPLDIDLDAVKAGETDLLSVLDAAKAMAEQAREAGDAALAKLEAERAKLPATPAPDPAKLRDELYARASAPAADLVGGEDANLGKMRAAFAQAAAAGQPIDPAQQQAALDGAAQLPALQRQARRISPQPLSESLAPALGEWLGQQVRQWYLAGVPLAGRDLSGAILPNIDLTKADLREVCFERADLRGAKMAGADLRKASLVGALLDGADLRGALLDEANFSQSHAHACQFDRARMLKLMAMQADWAGAVLNGAQLEDATMSESQLPGAALANAQLARCLLNGAQAAGSQWQGAELEMCVLLKADLSTANFSQARLKRTVLMDADLSGSNWSGAWLNRCVAMGAQAPHMVAHGMVSRGSGWRQVNMHGADLRGAGFIDSDLGQADLSSARLEGTAFSRSLLYQSKLDRAQAQGADFFGALCRKASFVDTDLRAANLRQAAVDPASLAAAQLNDAALDAFVALKLKSQSERRAA